MKNTAMVNGRVTAEQMDWLQARSEGLGGNLSAALRQTITEAQLLEMARSDYKAFLEEHPGFEIPYHSDDGTSWVFEVILNMREIVELGDAELRRLEEDDAK